MNKESANLLEWFGKRKEGVVADGLCSMSLSVRDCVRELGLAVRAMSEDDRASAEKAIDRLFKCEHEADAQEDELCNQISIGELGAQEREDFMRFIRKTDKIANWSKEAAISVRLADEVGLNVPKEIWMMLSQSVSDLESEVSNLSNAILAIGTDGDVMSCVQGVRDMERAIDRSYFDTTKAIFSSDMDLKSVIIVSRIADAIEMAADTCKGCSDTVVILHCAKRLR